MSPRQWVKRFADENVQYYTQSGDPIWKWLNDFIRQYDELKAQVRYLTEQNRELKGQLFEARDALKTDKQRARERYE